MRDFIHVRDLADLCLAALNSDASGCYNAGYGEGASVNDVVRGIDRTVQATGGAPVVPIYKPGRSFDVPRIILDIRRIRSATGWVPKTPLIQGMRHSWNWIQGHRSIDAIA